MKLMILQTPKPSTSNPAGGRAEVDSVGWFVIDYFYRGERDSVGHEFVAARRRHRSAIGFGVLEARSLTGGRTAGPTVTVEADKENLLESKMPPPAVLYGGDPFSVGLIFSSSHLKAQPAASSIEERRGD